MASDGITAEDIVELFRRDARARRELAVLLVSEPEVRLAIVNAVLREVATKGDLERLQQTLKSDIERLREATRQDFERLRSEVRQDIERLRTETRREIERLQQAIEGLHREIETLRRYIDERLERLREEFRSEIEELRMEVRELHERLWWVVGTLIAGWLAVVIEQLLLHMLAG